MTLCSLCLQVNSSLLYRLFHLLLQFWVFFFYNHRIWKSDSIMTPFCGYVRRPGQKTLGLVVTWQLSYVCCTVNISCWFNIKWLKQTWASFSVLTAEPKGQEIITQKTFLAKVTLIENYINHLEGKSFNWCHLSVG